MDDMWFFHWQVTPDMLLIFFILCFVIGVVNGFMRAGKDKWKR